jgi:DNA-binding transcriptional ArsR family regulator
VTAQETVEAMIEKSQRLRVPFRRSLVQKGTDGKVTAGPLAPLVRNHDERAYDLYLLMMAVATKEPYKANYEAVTWGRAIGLRGPSAPETVSRAWGRLAELGLVKRGRAVIKMQGVVRRVASLTPMQEDGSNNAYTRPAGGTKDERYFSIPVEYWNDGWHRSLPFTAKVMLVISLSLDSPNGFTLPAERVKEWYGISGDTAERGLRKLREVGLLDRRPEYKRMPLLGEGFVKVYRYSLKRPFDKATLGRRRQFASKGVRLEVVS